jgi:hypothetical protein
MHVLRRERLLDYRHYTLEVYAHHSARGPALNQSQIILSSTQVALAVTTQVLFDPRLAHNMDNDSASEHVVARPYKC